MAPQKPYSERLPLLDGLRTVAAIDVLLFHIPTHFDVPPLVSRSYLFVDLFFLLSGFVLTLSFEPKMIAGMSTADFMRKRFRRIWPTMALGALLGAAVFSTQADAGEVAWLLLLSLFLFPLASSRVAIFPLNAPQWSLVWELLGNVLHGLVLRRLSEAGLLIVAGAGAVGVAAATWYVGSGGSGAEGAFWYLAAPRIVWSYTLGVWMARRWRANRPKPLADWRTALFLPFAALFGLQWLPLAFGDGLAVLVILPALFWVAASAQPPEAVKPLLGRFGELSFPLYALHMPVLMAFSFYSRGTASGITAGLTAMALAWLLARIAPHSRNAYRSMAETLKPQAKIATPVS